MATVTKLPSLVRTRLFPLAAILVLVSAGCSQKEQMPERGQGSAPRDQTALDFVEGALPATATHGQVVYVPIYSSIYSQNSKRWVELTATLSLRNTDAKREIFIRTAKYFDTKGKLLEERFPKPVRLAPLQTVSIVVAGDDRRGGSGANFMVEWVAEPGVHEPVIEAVMVSVAMSYALAFSSPGRVVETISP